MNRIDGKIAVITGGTQGLGAAIAGLFAEAGAAGIAIVGRDRGKGEERARAITEATGVPVRMIAADLGSRLIDNQSQNKTVAARAMADRKTFGHLS